MTSLLTGIPAFFRMEKNRITLCYFSIFMLLGFVRALIGPSLVGLADHTGVGIDEISSLFTVIALGNLAGALGGGKLVDYLKGHPVLLFSLVLMGIMVSLTPLIPWFWLLLVVLLFLGVAEGFVDSGVNASLIWLHGQMIGPYINGLHFFYGFGALFSPIVIAQVIGLFGDFSAAYWIAAVMVLPVFLILRKYPSPTIKKQDEKTQKTIIKNKIDFRKVLPISLFFLFYAGSEVSFSSWIYTYALEMELSDIESAAYLTSFFWASFTFGRLVAIPISNRFKPLIMILVNVIGCLASLGLLVIWSESSVLLWIGTALLGFFMASIFPTMLNFAERRMQITGNITGIFFTGAGIGAMVLPWFIGQIFETIGPYITMIAILLNVFMAFILILIFILVESRNRQVRKMVSVTE